MYSRRKYGILVAFWVITILIFIATILMNIFARGIAPNIGLFNKSVDNLMDEAGIDMVPASWIQWYWVVIATWQWIWIIYFGINICRKGINEEPLVISPTLISLTVLMLFNLTNALNITGLFLWDNDFGNGGLVCMSLMMLFLWVALFSTFANLHQNLPLLDVNDLRKEKWYIRIFLQNGLAMYATYCTTVFFFQLDTVIKQSDNLVSYIDSTTIFFSVLIAVVVIYFILDITFFDRWLRYIFTPYVTVILVFSSIIDRNWGASWLRNYRNPALIASALGVVIIFTLTKIILTIGRRKFAKGKDKLNSDNEFLVDSPDPQ